MAVKIIFNIPENLERDEDLNAKSLIEAQINEEGKLVVEIHGDLRCTSLFGFLNSLSCKEQHTAFGYLGCKLIAEELRNPKRKKDDDGE